MGRRTGFDWHDNGALVWTWPLTLAVSGAALAVLAVSGVLWATDAIPAGGKVFGGAAMVAGIALFVAISGGLISANRLRYLDTDFPAVPDRQVTALGPVRQRHSTGRRSGTAYFWMVLMGGGFAGAALLNWSSSPRTITVPVLVLAACCVTGCYLAGPAARFVVTPQYLRIDTALRRITVPRTMIAGFARGPVKLRVSLTSGAHLDVRVDSPLCDLGNSTYRTNIRAQLRAAQRIVAMLRQVPAAPGTGGQVVTAPRPATRMLVIATGSVALVAFVALLVGIHGA